MYIYGHIYYDMHFYKISVQLLICIILITGCKQAEKSKVKQSLIVDKKELDYRCKKRNHTSKIAGYVQDVIKKEEYTSAK